MDLGLLQEGRFLGSSIFPAIDLSEKRILCSKKQMYARKLFCIQRRHDVLRNDICLTQHTFQTVYAVLGGARRQKAYSLYRELSVSCAQFLERGFKHYFIALREDRRQPIGAVLVLFYICSRLLFGRGFLLQANWLRATC